MQAFKIFDGLKIEEEINKWLKEKPQKKILQINQSIYHDGHLVISVLYSTK